MVKTLIDGERLAADTYEYTWDATDENGMHVGSGVYLYVMRAGSFVAKRKLVFMK